MRTKIANEMKLQRLIVFTLTNATEKKTNRGKTVMSERENCGPDTRHICSNCEHPQCQEVTTQFDALGPWGSDTPSARSCYSWPIGSGDQTPLQQGVATPGPLAGVVLRWENAWFIGTRVSPPFLTHHEQPVSWSRGRSPPGGPPLATSTTTANGWNHCGQTVPAPSTPTDITPDDHNTPKKMWCV